MKNSLSWIVSIIFVIALAVIYLLVPKEQPPIQQLPVNTNIFESNSSSGPWNLFIYKSLNPDIDYRTARIEGYQSQTDCIEKGISMTKKSGSFECGYKCEYQVKYQEEICKKVCGIRGCR